MIYMFPHADETGGEFLHGELPTSCTTTWGNPQGILCDDVITQTGAR
jgi:hypothetical protein